MTSSTTKHADYSENSIKQIVMKLQRTGTSHRTSERDFASWSKVILLFSPPCLSIGSPKPNLKEEKTLWAGPPLTVPYTTKYHLT